MERNESMLIAASYFWSDTFNAFIFGHGLASPTLADVVMLTGSDIATADNGQLFGRKAKQKVETRNMVRIHSEISVNGRSWSERPCHFSEHVARQIHLLLLIGRTNLSLLIGSRDASQW
jgi:hypothetical protein